MKFFLLLLSLFLIQCKTVNQFKLVESVGDASCSSYHVEDIDSQMIELPKNVIKALDCPSLLALEGATLFFLDGNVIKRYDLERQNETVLYKTRGEMDGYSNPLWSKDKKALVFVLINQNRNYGFKESGRLVKIIFSENGNILLTSTADLPIHYVCGSMCSSEPKSDFKFTSGNKVKYRRNENIEERPGEWEQVVWKI